MNWKNVRNRLETDADDTAAQAAYRQRLLAERAAALARPLELTEMPDPGGMLLLFSIGANSYAMPLNDVAEVLSLATPAPIPGAAAVVAGLIQVRGEMVPVYRLNELLGSGGAREESGPVVILALTGERHRIGLLAGEIGEILETSPGDYRDVPGDSRISAKLVGERTLVVNAAALRNALGAKKEN